MDVSRISKRVTVLVMMTSGLILFSGCGVFGLGSNEVGEASVSAGHSLAGVEFEGVEVRSITQQRMADVSGESTLIPVTKVRADFPFSIVTPRVNDLYPNRIDAVVVDGENMGSLYEESFNVEPKPHRDSIKDRMILYTLIDAASYVANCQANQMQPDVPLEDLLSLNEGLLGLRPSQCHVNLRLILRFWYPDARNSVFYQDVVIPSAVFWVNGILQVRPLSGPALGARSFNVDEPPPSDADLWSN